MKNTMFKLLTSLLMVYSLPKSDLTFILISYNALHDSSSYANKPNFFNHLFRLAYLYPYECVITYGDFNTRFGNKKYFITDIDNN